MDTFEFILEIVATVFYAISGIRLAAVKKFDWFGAYSIGFVTAIGGGTMRDVFLGTNPFWMLDPWYAIATIAALPVVMVFRRYLVRLEGTFYIFDAIGLALFVNVGIYKTLMLGHPMWVALIMGTITGSMGGVLRDIFINEVPLVFRKEIYATACIAGGIVYWLIGLAGGSSIVQQLACAVLVIGLRFFAVKHKWAFPAMSHDAAAVEEMKEYDEN
ncbi:MAG: trimeric intracellular cation channel family protein [Muribaculaceae bacterium]|nr:trimeric intracellular cation channel family protein [Muribaculaceae bacterium]